MRASVSRSLVRPALLGLDHLVQAALPGAVGHHAAGGLVDDLHLALDHHVLLVALVQVQRRQRLRQLLHALLAVPAARRRVVGVGASGPRASRHRPAGRRHRSGARASRALERSARLPAAARAQASAQPLRRGSGRRPPVADRISGVRASSMKTLSASSTMAKLRPRSTQWPALGPPGRLPAGGHRQVQRAGAVAQRGAVAQVVEGELLVAAVGDVAGVDHAALGRVMPCTMAPTAGRRRRTAAPSPRRRARPGSR
jgi:hypothetical protein